MLKGVNRKVIEVNRPDSAYFERAVLYLRPEVNEVPVQAAQREAEALLRHTERRGMKIRGWLLFLSGMAVAAGIFWYFLHLKS